MRYWMYDILFIGGAILCLYGLSLVYYPAAVVLGGVFLSTIGYLGARN